MEVTICGSNRFAKEAMAFGKKLEELGVVVYMPHFYSHNVHSLEELDDVNKPYIAMGLTHDHFMKIRLADVVFVYNKGGYSGNSTTLEIGYAVALDKPIYALSGKDEEICRDVLFRGVCETPENLVQVLKL